ncbi:hypothetical protein OGAPHI_006421 [Ogataea philodendri]|uniref:Uncharacterized protein n=1 Tax=Ogataea philodendri TaxID=1378263 RepID=A0A9P8NX86_9ASCO|nr:uncharacterized protein OGAPHI_006421 [Ogataea philodendri]KAH3661573.1 hypothetical protein OGAPHI_006421 [Ogataea philodendri]
MVLKNSFESLKLRQSSARVTSSNSMTIVEAPEEGGLQSPPGQKFWKYHVLQLSQSEFYLTTNPDDRHKFVRSAPGYYVNLELLKDNTRNFVSASNNGFRLVFTKQSYPKSNETGDILYDPVKSFAVEKQAYSKGGNVELNGTASQFVDEEGKVIDHMQDRQLNVNYTNKANSVSHNGMVMETCYKLGSSCVCSLKEKKSTILFKNKIDGVKLSKEGSIYFIDEQLGGTYWHDSILGLFRPCERDMKAKITKKVLSKGDSFHSSLREDAADNFEALNLDDDNESGTDRTFYYARDGLLQRHPQDDSPNDFKVGWVTIYDKADYFAKTDGKWEQVLGFTLVAAFEQFIGRISRDSVLI